MHSFLAPSAPKFAHSIPRRPKISFGCTRDFRVNMWATSLPEDKLAGDLGKLIEATSISGRRSDFFYSRKISAGQFGTFATLSAHRVDFAAARRFGRDRSEADMPRASGAGRSDEKAPKRKY